MPIDVIFYLIILILSVVVHELAHGYAAYVQGDPTAKYQGRLSLNPIRHIDPVGSVLVPGLLLLASGGSMAFGWAKPVPYNPYNLNDQRWGELKVALAGPLSNIALALVFGLLLRAVGLGGGELLAAFLATAVLTNLVLAVFNMIPVPPLDGSKVLYAFIPYDSGVRDFMERYGLILVLLVVFYAWKAISPVVYYLFDLIV